MAKREKFEGLVFVACMFIGGGLGLAFGRPDVGGAIGMGVGFLLMAMLRAKRVEATPITLLVLDILVTLSGDAYCITQTYYIPTLLV